MWLRGSAGDSLLIRFPSRGQQIPNQQNCQYNRKLCEVGTGDVKTPTSVMSGKIGGGTGDGERGALHSMGSVLTASDWRDLGGDQTVDFGAKKLDRLLPMTGKTRRLSELLLHRITR